MKPLRKRRKRLSPFWIQSIGLAGWLFLSFAVAGFGSRFRPGDWYRELDKAPWTPPDWVFGVVWSILYVLMAVAAWLVWRSGGFEKNRHSLGLYLWQLGFNALWSWLFFGLRQPGWALLDLVFLLIALLATQVLFWKRSPLAGALLVPYLLWGVYAFTLNAWIWWNN